MLRLVYGSCHAYTFLPLLIRKRMQANKQWKSFLVLGLIGVQAFIGIGYWSRDALTFDHPSDASMIELYKMNELKFGEIANLVDELKLSCPSLESEKCEVGAMQLDHVAMDLKMKNSFASYIPQRKRFPAGLVIPHSYGRVKGGVKSSIKGFAYLTAPATFCRTCAALDSLDPYNYELSFRPKKAIGVYGFKPIDDGWYLYLEKLPLSL